MELLHVVRRFLDAEKRLRLAETDYKDAEQVWRREVVAEGRNSGTAVVAYDATIMIWQRMKDVESELAVLRQKLEEKVGCR